MNVICGEETGPYNPRMITDTREILDAAWRGYFERFRTFFTEETAELRIAGAGIPVPLFNVAYPKQPIRSNQFERVSLDFSHVLARRGVSGLLMGRADWIEAHEGEEPAIRMPGMVAGELIPPARRAPDVEIQEVRGPKMAEEIARLNVLAHGMPAEEIEPMTCPAMWEAPNHGFLLYAEDEAVASGSASFAAGASYIGWMATDAKHRGRGYAEAILRHMDAFMRRRYGVTESVLHATELGRPVYERVGFRAVDDIVGYLVRG